MLNATIRLPTLRCVKQYDESGKSEPYLWLAYMWADSTTHGAKIYVPSFTNVRGMFPGNVGDNQNISIPVELGRFQVDLEDTGGMALAVFAVLLEEDETPDDAIEAGYAEFGAAVGREITQFALDLLTHGMPLRPPTEAELEQIVGRIKSSIFSAIESKLGILSKCFDNQDDFIGYSVYFFWNGDLHIRDETFPMPPIDADAQKIVITSYNPLRYNVVVAGHNHYEFVNPAITVRRVESVCPDQVVIYKKSVTEAKRLRGELRRLKKKRAKGTTREAGTLGKQIEAAKSKIQAADKKAAADLQALNDCLWRSAQVR